MLQGQIRPRRSREPGRKPGPATTTSSTRSSRPSSGRSRGGRIQPEGSVAADGSQGAFLLLSPDDLTAALQWRCSVKQFDPNKRLSDADFRNLLDALRLSASSFGLQPWRFVVVADPALRERLLPVSWNQRQVVDASHLLVLCRLREIGPAQVDAFVGSIAKARGATFESQEGYRQMMLGFLKRLSPQAAAAWMENQVYIALGTLLTACAVRGIDACPMEGLDRAKYDEILGLTERGLATVVACPVGHRSAADRYALAPKVRFPHSEIVLEL